MPRAAEFRHWLFGEVLPTMEVTGAYILDEAKEEYENDPKSFEERYKESEVKLKDLRKILENERKEKQEIKQSLGNTIDELNQENATLNNKVDEYEDAMFKHSIGHKYVELLNKTEQLIDDKNAAYHLLRQSGYLHPETVTQFSKPLIKMN